MTTRAVLPLLLLASAAGAQVPERPPSRELTTDRPDKTEAPQTVDRGHFQVELDAVTFVRDRADGALTETVSVAPFNLKYGIGRDTDVQIVVAPYQRQTVMERGGRTVIAGFGDVTVRVKHNLWGNDGGTTALAVMPFVTVPTARDGLGADGVEGGLIVPLSVKLSDHVDLGLMTEIYGVRDGARYRAAIINSATIGFALTDRLGLYTELYTEHDRAWIITGDAGVTLAVGDNAQLDAGVNLGLTRAADDVGLFLGFSRRF